ncbi:MAG TPA: metallophosphoesterase [Xanthobacteraceae bacterium]|nr:metallophosphoesterase [Xanthobacteraceae bacterium]
MKSGWLLLCGIIAAVSAALPQQAQSKILAQWVQLGPDSAVSARAVTDDACPSITFDGVAVAMKIRSDPKQSFTGAKPGQFPVRGCEAAVPPGTIAAVLGGKPLPLPRPNPQRIVMFGDTGCRLKVGDPTQACNDPNAWPFMKVAAMAAAARPDLVVHVGDYEYREDACPAGNAGCANSPYGYGWQPWNADFFEPSAALFAAAPWVMVRGNHEDCDRAGEGWFRFLDPAPMEATCRDLTGDYVIRLGDFGLLVVDSARVKDTAGEDSDQVPIVRRQLLDVLAKIPDNTWLVTHKPVNAMLAKPGDRQFNIPSNRVLQAGLGADMPAGVRMYVAGHIHFFQADDFGGARPAQLVVGTGGDNLEGKPMASVEGADINGRKALSAVTYSGFGYTVWDRVERDIWTGTLFDVEGKVITHCRLADRSLSCGS